MNEQVTFGGHKLTKKLTEIFNQILETSKIPLEWKKLDLIVIFQKGTFRQKKLHFIFPSILGRLYTFHILHFAGISRMFSQNTP